MRSPARISAALLLFCAHTFGLEAPSRLPVPESTKVAEAEKRIIKSRKALNLHSLLEMSKNASDATECYAGLRMVFLGCMANDDQLAKQAFSQIAQRFKLNEVLKDASISERLKSKPPSESVLATILDECLDFASGMKVSGRKVFWDETVKLCDKGTSLKIAFIGYMQMANDAIALDEYRDALEASASGTDLANRNSQNAEFRRIATVFKVLQDEIKGMKAEYDDLKINQTGEITGPTSLNQLQNLWLGRFLCLVKGDWTKGLAHLSASSFPEDAILAEKETAAASSEKDQLMLGDLYWDRAEKEKKSDLYRRGYYRRAAYWYRQGFTKLGVLALPADRKRIAGRLDAISDILRKKGEALLEEEGAAPWRNPRTRAFLFRTRASLEAWDANEMKFRRLPGGGLLSMRGDPRIAARSNDKVSWPVRATFFIHCEKNGCFDIWPGLFSGESAIRFFWADKGGSETTASLFGKRYKIQNPSVLPDKTYRAEIAIDRNRVLTIRLDGKELFRQAIDASVGNRSLTGSIILEGGVGAVVFEKVIIEEWF